MLPAPPTAPDGCEAQGAPPLPPPPDAPPADGYAWSQAAEAGPQATAVLEWQYYNACQQMNLGPLQQQTLQHPPPLPPHVCWGPQMATGDSQTIPAEWGNASFPFPGGNASNSSGRNSGGAGWGPHTSAPGGYAATWPPPGAAEGCGGGMAAPCGPPFGGQGPPHMDPQAAADLYVAAVPWYSSWPAPEQQFSQAYMLASTAAASDNLAMMPPHALPPQHPQQYLQQHAHMPGYGHAPPPGCLPQAYSYVLPAPAPAPLLHPPAFAISPPGPPPLGCRHGLARKKKAALPAEPSFGCESANLDSGGSAVLLQSAEPSQTGDDLPSFGFTAGGGGGQQQQQQQQQTVGGSESSPIAAAAQAAAAAQQALPSIEFDKAPRPVDWRPYSLADYRQKNYDPKQAASKYWALGGLGPARPPSDAEWQAQQGKRERQQSFGQTVSKSNRQRLASLPARLREPPPRPGADVRQRALQFAKTGVPKPSSFKSRAQGAGGSLNRAASGCDATAAAAAEAAAEVHAELAERLADVVLEDGAAEAGLQDGLLPEEQQYMEAQTWGGQCSGGQG